MPSSSACDLVVAGDRRFLATAIAAASLCRNAAWRVRYAPTADEALQLITLHSADALATAKVLPDSTGLLLLDRAAQSHPGLHTIALVTEPTDGPEDIALADAAEVRLWAHPSQQEALSALMDRWAFARRPGHEDLSGFIPGVIAVLDTNGVVRFVAGPVERLMGRRPEDIVGRPMGNMVVEPREVERLLDTLRTVARTGEPSPSTEIHIRGRAGEAGHWIRVVFSPGGKASTDEVVIVAQDVTEEVTARRELDRINHDLEIRRRTAEALQGTLDLSTAIRAAAQTIQETYLADATVILVFGTNGKPVIDFAALGFSDEIDRAYQSAFDEAVRAGVIMRAVETGRPVLLTPDNFADLVYQAPLLRAQGLEHGVCVPICVDGEVAALLAVVRRGEEYTAREVDVLEGIASTVAATAEIARAHERLRQALEASDRLLDLSLAINTQRGLDEILQATAEAGLTLPGAVRCTVAVLPAGEEGRPTRHSASALVPGSDDGAICESLLEATLSDGRPRAALRDDPQWQARWPEDAVHGSVCVQALKQQDRLIGAIGVCRRSVGDLSEQDALTLSMLAAHASLAVHKARLLERARSSEALYRDLFELSGVPMAVYDRTGTLTMVNDEFENLSGYARQEAVGELNVFELMHPDDREPMRRMHEAYWRGEKDLTTSHDFRGLRKSGEVRFISASLHRVPGRNRVTAVLIDNTEPLQLQRQLIQSEKAAALGQLVSGVAHELNNPLTTILGYAQLMQDTTDPSLAARAEMLEAEARRSQRIIEGLLSFARERPVHVVATDVNTVVLDALRIPAYRMRTDNILIHTHLDPNVPTIAADPHQLQQVFLNIINNAHAAMETDGGELTVSTRHVGPRVEIEFADTGPGITERNAARAFDPFFTTRDVNDGTGLGLSVSQGIVQRHGGEIRLVTLPGEGATFTVALPAGQSAAPETTAPVADLALQPGISVLVVDDEQPLLSLVQKALSSEGAEVVTANSAGAALRHLERRTFDVILSDLRMPDMDGEHFYRAVATRWPQQVCRFVIVTGDTVGIERSEFIRSTGIRTLAKPFAIRDLHQIVAHVVRDCGRA